MKDDEADDVEAGRELRGVGSSERCHAGHITGLRRLLHGIQRVEPLQLSQHRRRIILTPAATAATAAQFSAVRIGIRSVVVAVVGACIARGLLLLQVRPRESTQSAPQLMPSRSSLQCARASADTSLASKPP